VAAVVGTHARAHVRTHAYTRRTNKCLGRSLQTRCGGWRRLCAPWACVVGRCFRPKIHTAQSCARHTLACGQGLAHFHAWKFHACKRVLQAVSEHVAQQCPRASYACISVHDIVGARAHMRSRGAYVVNSVWQRCLGTVTACCCTCMRLRTLAW